MALPRRIVRNVLPPPQAATEPEQVEAAPKIQPSPPKIMRMTPRGIALPVNVEDRPGQVEPPPAFTPNMSAAAANFVNQSNAAPSLMQKLMDTPLSPLARGMGRQPGHVIVDALAGTGKTFAILEACRRIMGVGTKGLVDSEQQEVIWAEICRGARPATIVVLAFNSAIAAELKKKVPNGVTAMTSHSFGLQMIYKSGLRTKLDKDAKVNKTMILIEDWFRTVRKEDYDIRSIKRAFPKLVDAVEMIVRQCKIGLIDIDRMTVEDRDAKVEELVGYYSIELEPKYLTEHDPEDIYPYLPAMCADILTMAADMTELHDFDDMVWWPHRKNLDVRKVDLLLVDERQDLNLAQQELVCKAGRRIVLVGDVNQAIYAFAGADAHACQRMAARLQSNVLGCVTLPLTRSRRCSKAVIREAQRYVSTIEAMPNAVEGTVSYDDEETFAAKLLPDDMVVCRTNAPLARWAMNLLKQGKRVRIQGTDIGEGLIYIIESMNAGTVPDLIQSLDRHFTYQLANLRSMKFCPEEVVAATLDKWHAMQVFCEDARSVTQVIQTIEYLFGTRCSACGKKVKHDTCKACGKTRDTSGTLFASIHKSKGLEAPRVWFLQYDRCPHPAAKADWEIEQEFNLIYVAITRAMNDLVYVASEEREEDEADY